MNSADDDAEDRYQAALGRLREQAATAVVELAGMERDCAGRDYPTRWALVHVAASLRHPAALPFLRNLVLTPIPAEQSPDSHSFSSVAEETILRTTAVDGVGALAADGNREAQEALVEFVAQPSLSIRRAAVQSIMATPRGRSRGRQIAALLPEDQRFLLDLKPADVHDVPQVARPERHLSDTGRRAQTVPPPNLLGEASRAGQPGDGGPSVLPE